MPVTSQSTSPVISIPTTNFGDLQPEVIKPQRKSFCHAVFESGNAKCALLSGTVVAFIAVSTWCQILARDDDLKNSDYENGEYQCTKYLAVPIIFASLFYIIYLMENWQYYSKQEDVITISIPSIQLWIDKMKRSLPIVWWKVTCYHYAVYPCRHGHSSNSSPASAGSRIHSNVSYRRINSCSGVGRYNFLSHGFRDVSSQLEGLHSEPMARIHFSKSFVFFTREAAKEFEEQRKQFFQEYEARDDYMEMREGMDLMDIDFPDEVVVVRDPQRLPWWRRRWMFIVCVLLLLAAPLRIALSIQTATVHYNVLKVFGMDARESNWDPALALVPTADQCTTLPELPIQRDILPPSYSEIMLQTYTTVPPRHAANRPVTLPLPSSATLSPVDRRTSLIKSSTFALASLPHRRSTPKVETLADGIRARGLATPGCEPVTPKSELKTLEYSEVLRRNRPQIVEDSAAMYRSHTAPNLTAVFETTTPCDRKGTLSPNGILQYVAAKHGTLL